MYDLMFKDDQAMHNKINVMCEHGTHSIVIVLKCICVPSTG